MNKNYSTCAHCGRLSDDQGQSVVYYKMDEVLVPLVILGETYEKALTAGKRVSNHITAREVEISALKKRVQKLKQDNAIMYERLYGNEKEIQQGE